LLPLVPLPVLPVLGVVGAGAGVGLVVLPGIPPLVLPPMLPLVEPPVVAPVPAPLRRSRRHVSRCSPMRSRHLLLTSTLVSAEPPPLTPALPLAPVVLLSLALEPDEAPVEPDAEPLPEDWAMAAEDRARRAAAVAAVSVFNIMMRVSWKLLGWTASGMQQALCPECPLLP
jgi:hypothetical protein